MRWRHDCVQPTPSRPVRDARARILESTGSSLIRTHEAATVSGAIHWQNATIRRLLSPPPGRLLSVRAGRVVWLAVRRLLVAVGWLLVGGRGRRRLGRLNVRLPLPVIVVLLAV